MFYRPMRSSSLTQHQSGATLIEVLVTVLILSIGLLAMGAMMSYATLMPKFSGNRSVAMSTATNMIERMRANPSTWNSAGSQTFSIKDSYGAAATFSTTPGSTSLPSGSTCSFPNCTQATIATMDIALVQQQLNQQLPPAGMTIDVPDATKNEGNLWVIWQEPSTYGSFSTSGSDSCPPAVKTLNLTLTPAARCVYLPFKL